MMIKPHEHFFALPKSVGNKNDSQQMTSVTVAVIKIQIEYLIYWDNPDIHK